MTDHHKVQRQRVLILLSCPLHAFDLRTRPRLETRNTKETNAEGRQITTRTPTVLYFDQEVSTTPDIHLQEVTANQINNGFIHLSRCACRTPRIYNHLRTRTSQRSSRDQKQTRASPERSRPKGIFKWTSHRML